MKTAVSTGWLRGDAVRSTLPSQQPAHAIIPFITCRRLRIDPLYQDIGRELGLGTVDTVECIQTLWGGYGELVRVAFAERSVIIKHVTLPKPASHPRGWNSDRSHQRKLRSYAVEVHWYDRFSTPVDDRCRTPRGLKSFQAPDEWLIVMEDLATAGYTDTAALADSAHLETVIVWLANFHARHMGMKSEKLWENGTYWHLRTRPDELEALDDLRLKEHAELIDAALNQTRYATFVHGDAKLANFCFFPGGRSAAAVDFQYVGHGCGMKDLAYFMGSALAPETYGSLEPWVLDTYFSELEEALGHYRPSIDSGAVEAEWRPLFVVAWADFQRFIKGWSPGHGKINVYAEALTKRALDQLSSR